jgi:uncharacterized membrane protein
MNTPTPSFKLFRVCEMSTGRIQAFSDGVFSIVMTLLVLEIHVPYVTGPNVSVELARDLSAMMPKFFSYALSFGIVCIWWVAHHHLYDVLRKSDRGLLWFNSLFLFWLAFIPFPTAMLGDYPKERIAVICYGAVMMLAGFSFSWMRYYAFFIGELTYPDVDRDLLKRAMIKSAFNPILHLSAVMLAFVSTTLAITLYVIIPMLFFVPSRLERNTMNSDRTLG